MACEEWPSWVTSLLTRASACRLPGQQLEGEHPGQELHPGNACQRPIDAVQQRQQSRQPHTRDTRHVKVADLTDLEVVAGEAHLAEAQDMRLFPFGALVGV